MRFTVVLNSTFILLRGRVTPLDLLSQYMLMIELRFDALLCSNLGNAKSGHINVYTGRRFPSPVIDKHMRQNAKSARRTWQILDEHLLLLIVSTIFERGSRKKFLFAVATVS